MKHRAVTAGLLLLATSLPVVADSIQEISHLLTFVADSGCTYVRNGKQYDAAKAREHIERKYEYLRDRISTTEQFIKYAATESSTSGQPYTVICSGQEEPSADWLSRELARYRATTPKASR
jgi:hypothetical protein